MAIRSGRIEKALFYLLLFLLPTQLGKHFWPSFSVVSGIRIDYLSPTLYITDLLIVGLISLWFYRLHKAGKLRSVFANFHVFGIYCFFLVLTIIFGKNLLNGAYHMVKLLEFFLIFLYVARQQWTWRTIEFAVVALCCGAVFESVLAILQFFKHGSIGGLLYFAGERTFYAGTPGIANASVNGQLILRPYATFPHPNVLAGYLLVVMSFCLMLLGKKTSAQVKALFIATIAIGTVALLLTMSRIAIILWGGIVLGAGVKKILQHGLSKKLSLVVFLSIFLFGYLLFMTGGGVIGERILGTTFFEESVVVRQVLIQSSWEMVSKSPFWGVGLGNFLPVLSLFQNGLFTFSFFQPVHNIFLLALAETGLIGFFFLLLFLSKTYGRLLLIWKSKLNSEYYGGLLILVSAVLVLGQFDHYFFTLQQGQLLFAVLLGLCWTKKITSN